MKTLTFYILSIEDLENALIYHKKFNNSLIKHEDGKFYFYSKFNPKEEIDYYYSVIDLNIELVKTIERIFEKSLIEAKNISTENMGVEIKKGELVSNITSIVNKYSYYEIKDGKDFFDLITEIFIRILMGHYLSNGNKRVALIMLKAILWHFGYYLMFTKGMWKNYTKHKTKVEEFVQNLENKKENNITNEYTNIKSWIMENVIIGLNWWGR